MKTLNKIFITLFAASILPSCSMFDSLLTEELLGSYTAETFYSSETNAINGLVRAYSIMIDSEYSSRALIHIMDASTDVYESYGFTPAQTQPWHDWDVDSNTWELHYLFKYIGLSVNEANTVYENVRDMDSSDISDESRSQLMGEARFLRAYHYFNAVRIWGDFPIHATSISSADDGIIAYTSIEGVYDFIIADLEEAISLTKVQRIQSRADKVCAQFLLSKVYLTLASSKETGAPGYDWVEDADAMYAKSLEYSRMVVNDQTTYYLDDINKIYSVDHEDSPEHLWISEHSLNGSSYNSSGLLLMYAVKIDNKHIVTDVTQAYSAGANIGADNVRAFGDVSEAAWTNYTPSRKFYNSFEDGDYRKRLMATTIYDAYGAPIVTWAEDNYLSEDATTAAFYFPMCIKWTDSASTGSNSSVEIYHMRFAEAMLVHAEAAGNTDEGYASLNAVRARAGLGELSGLTDDEYQLAVWDEYEKEMAFESHNLAFLRRTNRVREKITRSEIAAANNENLFELYADFFPIPQREQDLNPQN